MPPKSKKSVKRRLPPNAGKGRKKGVPNKITRDVRETMALFARRNIGELEGWIDRVARKNPAKAAQLFLQAIEYHTPKLARTELANAPGSDALTVIVKKYDFPDNAAAPVGSQALPDPRLAGAAIGH